MGIVLFLDFSTHKSQQKKEIFSNSWKYCMLQKKANFLLYRLKSLEGLYKVHTFWEKAAKYKNNYPLMIWTSLNKSVQHWTSLNKFVQGWTKIDQIGQVYTNIDMLEHVFKIWQIHKDQCGTGNALHSAENI